jgi:hypothetical protein
MSMLLTVSKSPALRAPPPPIGHTSQVVAAEAVVLFIAFSPGICAFITKQDDLDV